MNCCPYEFPVCVRGEILASEPSRQDPGSVSKLSCSQSHESELPRFRINMNMYQFAAIRI